MRDRFLAAWRTAAQAVFALLLAWLANRGLHIDPHWSGLAEIALIGAGAGVWAGVTHWLQSQTGPAWWAVAARTVARILLLGATNPPTYTPTGSAP